MITTPNMGLFAWDLSKDKFSHEQLSENFRAIDLHNHSKGRGVQLSGESLFPESIENEQLAREAVEGKNVKQHTLGSEQIETGFLPLGFVAYWYRQNMSSEPGPNWVICDGRAFPTNSAGFTGDTPNLIDKFIMGSSYADIGGEGGFSSLNLSHSHTVNAHTHEVGSHTHTIGAHKHLIQGHTHGLAAHAHSISSDLSVLGFQFTGVGAPPYYSLFQTVLKYESGSNSVQFLRFANTSVGENTELPMQSAGHNHGGGTGFGGGGSTEANTGFESGENSPFASGANSTFNTGASTASTTSALGSVSIIPPYVELAPIMKIN